MQNSSNPPSFQEGAKAYRNGFFAGAFTGVVICIVIGKAIFTLPVILGLFFGAVAFDRKM